MLEDLWNGILELMAQFVIPDWGALVALLPVMIFVLTLVILVAIFLRLYRAPKAHRGKARLVPRTPAGLHLPGPSWAPVVASIGLFLAFLGIVFPGPLLWIGLIALGLSLLYWLGESIRIYDRDLGENTRTDLPAVVHDGPPPGVHLPGPSFRPVLGAVGVSMLGLGLVFGSWLLAVGVIALIATLVGWLIDARKEYVKAVEADATGHLESLPTPRTPSLLFAALAVLLIGGVVLEAGWLPPRDVSGGEGGPGASGAPPASGGPPPSGAPPASGPPGASGEPGGSGAPQADVVVHAQGIEFVETTITAPADRPFTLAFVNEDAGTPHNVEFKDGGGASVFQGEVFNGVATEVYDVPALPAGAYTFVCTVHPNMTGSATLQ